MKILFMAAHADDIEVACPNTVKRFIDRGDEVIMALATCDEYAWLHGKQCPAFKGARQARIRIHEMNQAAKAYGVDKEGKARLVLHWLGWIDGHVPLTRDAFQKMRGYMARVNPDVVFAPDGFASLDHHDDHDRTGILTYLACRSLARPPRLFLWQSWKNNAYFPVKVPAFSFIPVMAHATQFPRQSLFVKLERAIWWLLATLRRVRSGGILAESLRLVTYTRGEHDLVSITDRIKHAVSHRIMAAPPRNIYQPEPASLGLETSYEIVYRNTFDYATRAREGTGAARDANARARPR